MTAGPLSPRTIRLLVQLVCVAGIGGMIAGSIKDNNGVAITFGLVTAVSVVFLILLTSVVGPAAFRPGVGGAGVDPELAEEVEARVQSLVNRGADEREVRELVTRAMDLRGHGAASRP